MNVLRQRKQALKIVKELDAFPKVPESYKETTVSGGGVSLIVFGLILILVISEIRYYSETELKFDYEVDSNHTGKLKLNVDMTIAMKCRSIGADVLDHTGSTAASFGRLGEQPAYFDLTPSQSNYLQMIQQINNYIKNEYHAIHHLLWKSGYTGGSTQMPPRGEHEKPEGEPDGCRIYGSLTLNKVAGNFHVTAGKVMEVDGHHKHAIFIGGKLNKEDYNFSHRIDHFSFGEKTPGVVNPLDGDFKIAKDNYHMFQYFVQVVPTKVNTMQANVDTFQYAVTENNRTINHGKGSHGVPGIFVKYDLSSLKVLVKEERKPYWQFLVRLCGIVGGIFATSGMLHSIVGFILNVIFCRFQGDQQAAERRNSVQPSTPGSSVPSTPLTPPPQSQTLFTQNLMTSSQSEHMAASVTLLPQGGSSVLPPCEDVPL